MNNRLGPVAGAIACICLALGAGPSLEAQTPAAGFGQAPGGNTGRRAESEATAMFAGGCYWGVESVFEHVRGVRNVVSGFAVPAAASGASTPASGHAGYAEAVRVVYDPSRITYEQLLGVFFLVAHDPTEVDRQGPDIGPQYRSVIFVDGEGQRRAAQTYLDDLTARRILPRPITTEIVPAGSFRPAPDQDYAVHNPASPYVVGYDLPKLAALRRRFPALYRE